MNSLSARRFRDRYLTPRADAAIGLALYESPVLESSLEAVLPDGSSSWAVSAAFARLLAGIALTHGTRRILEFGAGASSVVLARALSVIGGGMLTSVESAPEWCANQWALVVAESRVDARLVKAKPQLRLARGGMSYRFDKASAAIGSRAPFDLVVVDAPQSYYGRDGALPLAWSSLAEGALFVLDDAGREGERYTIARWLRTFPGMDLVAFHPDFGGRGVAILRRARNMSPSFDWWSFATSAMHTIRNVRARATAELNPIPLPSIIDRQS